MKRSKAREYNLIMDDLDSQRISEDNVAYLMNTIRKGLDFSYFLNILKNSPFSLSEWSDFLHLSERTMQRYKKDQKKFDALQSEKILQITLLYKRGLEVFGDQKKFDSWLNSNNLVFSNNKPKNLLDTAYGIQLIDEELQRIEHGILA